MDSLEIAKAELFHKEATCVAVRNGEQLFCSYSIGIQPLWEAYDLGNVLTGCDVADKVVGKAAAYLFCYMGIRSLYAKVISEHACRVLDQEGIPYQYEEQAQFISNRKRDGMCPMEEAVLHLDPKDKGEAFKILEGRRSVSKGVF